MVAIAASRGGLRLVIVEDSVGHKSQQGKDLHHRDLNSL